MKVSTVGLDLAKNDFQVHGIDVEGAVVVRRVLRRRQVMPFFEKLDPCLIGMEACATSHYRARELIGLGHEVKLMPPAYVKPYVKRGKTDAADAEAICEAVTRPTMRYVAAKGHELQSILALHRTRDFLIRQRTQLVNMIRAQFASGRQFAAWLRLTPRANSSGGKERLGHISKMGDRYLRRLLVNGMMSRLRWLRLRPDAQPWAAGLLRRKPAKLVAVAMANKTARIAWAVMTRGETYRPRPTTRELAA